MSCSSDDAYYCTNVGENQTVCEACSDCQWCSEGACTSAYGQCPCKEWGDDRLDCELMNICRWCNTNGRTGEDEEGVCLPKNDSCPKEDYTMFILIGIFAGLAILSGGAIIIYRRLCRTKDAPPSNNQAVTPSQQVPANAHPPPQLAAQPVVGQVVAVLPPHQLPPIQPAVGPASGYAPLSLTKA